MQTVQVGKVWNRAAILLCLVTGGAFSQAVNSGWDGVWQMPDETEGRLDFLHPSPRCCHSTDCVQMDKGRYAIVTSIRTPQYMILLKELHCSLQEHHAHIPLIAIAVDGDLSPSDVEEIQTFAEYREVDDLFFPNYDSARYALNWMKLRVWGMDAYDGVLLIDSDTTVHQDLTHLFHLPTDFAWAADQGANWTWNAGGFIFLRPCKPVMDHMVQLVRKDERLQFRNKEAEQSFWSWYFRYSGMRLPIIYNANHHILELGHGLTVGGDKPAVVHFAYGREKPFNITPESPEWKYSCYRPKKWAEAHNLAVSLAPPGSAQSALQAARAAVQEAMVSRWQMGCSWMGKAV